jgi:hypothetical protein
VYPLLARGEVEGLRESLGESEDFGARTAFRLRQLVVTLLAAWDANESVSRFAREVDLPPGGVNSTDGYTAAYVAGYAAARGELRALLGIEEGT